MLAGFRARGADPAPEPTPPAAITTPAPAGSTSFDAVTARLDRGGSLYLYLSAADWLGHLSKTLAEWRDIFVPGGAAATQEGQSKDDAQAEAREAATQRQNISQGFALAIDFVKKSGLEQITGVGASSLEIEPGIYRNTVFIHHEKGQETGLLETLLGTAPHPLTALDLLPADTAAAVYDDRDIAGLVTALRQTVDESGQPDLKRALNGGLKQFSKATGLSFDDFLSSLGNSQGMILTLDPNKPVAMPMPGGQTATIPAPRLAVLIAVKNDLIYQRVEQMLAIFPGIEKVDEPGLRMLTMSVPALAELKVRATVARWDQFLILASDDQLVRDIIAARKSGQGFKASPVFAKLAAGLPTAGNGFSLMTETFTKALRQFQTTMLDNQPGSAPVQQEVLRRISAFQTTGASYGVTAHVEDGWLSISKAPQSLSKVMAPLFIVPFAIGAAMPAFNAAQQAHSTMPTDMATKSLDQAKQIALGCRLYAGDYDGKFPASLHALVPNYLQDDTLFVSPFAPQYPLGYTYTPGLTTESPEKTVLLEDKFSGSDNKRVIVHVDGSGEILPLPAH